MDQGEAEYSELGCGTSRSKVTAGGTEQKIEAEESRAGEEQEHFNNIYFFISYLDDLCIFKV